MVDELKSGWHTIDLKKAEESDKYCLPLGKHEIQWLSKNHWSYSFDKRILFRYFMGSTAEFLCQLQSGQLDMPTMSTFGEDWRENCHTLQMRCLPIFLSLEVFISQRGIRSLDVF